MASKAHRRLIDRSTALLERPANAQTFLLVSVGIIVLGAIYCSGYESLTSGLDNWPGSLVWATYALLPWYLLFEGVKRVEARRSGRLSIAAIALAILLTGAASLAAEQWVRSYSQSPGPPLLLSLLRRAPGIAVVITLITLNRIVAPRAVTEAAATAAAAAEDLRSIEAIRWIGAADNYLEVHYADRMAMVRMTMRDAERRLAQSGFVRVHRSTIVNRAYVAEVANGDRGLSIRLIDGTELAAGKAFAPNVRQLT